MSGLAATSSSDGFSLPLLLFSAGVAVAWLLAVSALWVSRRPPHVDGRGPSMELGAEPPAVASLLCDDYEVRTETAPATLLDLAARGIVELDEIRPGETICRVEPDGTGTLAPFEQHLLAALRAKAIDGVIPATALTTGTEDASARWHRQLAQMVVVDAQQRGLTVDRWPKVFGPIVGAGALAVAALIFASAQVGGDAEDHPVVAGVAVAIAVVGAFLIGAIASRMTRSLAQSPTDAGRGAEARWLGVRAHLAQNEQLQSLPPASVKLYGRHFAYAAAFGLAEHAIAALPFGEEDDHLAWSPQGGRWRRVRVRYPRVRPPGWGRHPVLATVLGLFWTGLAGYLISRLIGTEGGFQQLAAAVLAVPLIWGLWVLSAAVPDLFTARVVTGTVLRCRTRRRFLSSNDSPTFWYYVAIDDGTRDRIAAFRVPEARYSSVHQGQTVTAEVAPRLGYVRTLQ